MKAKNKNESEKHMKIKDGYILREVAGTAVVVPVDPGTNFHSMLKLNPTGKLLWEKLLVGADVDALVSAVTAEYEIDGERAKADIEAFLVSLRAYGILEE